MSYSKSLFQGLITCRCVLIIWVLALTFGRAGADHGTNRTPIEAVTMASSAVLGSAEPDSATPSNLPLSFCRIDVASPQGKQFGSGTLIRLRGQSGIVLTCAHLFPKAPSSIGISWANGHRNPGQLLLVDRLHDLGAVLVRHPPARPQLISPGLPTGSVQAGGYGTTGSFRWVDGSVLGYALATGARHPSVRIAGSVRPGDSGGPVLNVRQELVGVVWGASRGATYAACGQSLRNFLRRIDAALATHLRNQPRHIEDSSASISHTRLACRTCDAALPGGAPGGVPTRVDCPSMVNRCPASPRTCPTANPPAAAFPLQRSSLRGIGQRDIGQPGIGDFRAAPAKDDKSLPQSGVPLLREEVVSVLRDWVVSQFWRWLPIAGGPLATVVFCIGWWMARRRRWHGSPRSPPTAWDHVPPLPSRCPRETRYVPYETDEFAKAHQWAKEQIARKYPGSVDLLQTLESLIQQHLNSQH